MMLLLTKYVYQQNETVNFGPGFMHFNHFSRSIICVNILKKLLAKEMQTLLLCIDDPLTKYGKSYQRIFY